MLAHLKIIFKRRIHKNAKYKSNGHQRRKRKALKGLRVSNLYHHPSIYQDQYDSLTNIIALMRPTSPAVAITRTKTANTKKRQRLHLPCPSCQMGGQRTPPWPETREVEEKRARGSKRRNILRLGLLIAGRGRFGDSSYCQTSTRVNIVQVSRSCVRYKGGVVCPFCHHWTRCGPITWVELLFFFAPDTWWSFHCSPFLYA